MISDAVASYLEADVHCFHCGHISGQLRRHEGGHGTTSLFVPSNGGPVRRIRSLTEIRCARCQGSVFTDDFETRYVYPKVNFDDDEQPRRGRPPKRLAQLRDSRQVASRSA